MTNLEALMAECEPYTVTQKVAEKAINDNSLNPEDEYFDKKAIAKTAIDVLSRFLSLTSEREGAFGQGFDKEGLIMRIKALCQVAGIDASGVVKVSSISDGSHRW